MIFLLFAFHESGLYVLEHEVKKTIFILSNLGTFMIVIGQFETTVFKIVLN